MSIPNASTDDTNGCLPNSHSLDSSLIISRESAFADSHLTRADTRELPGMVPGGWVGGWLQALAGAGRRGGLRPLLLESTELRSSTPRGSDLTRSDGGFLTGPLGPQGDAAFDQRSVVLNTTQHPTAEGTREVRGGQ